MRGINHRERSGRVVAPALVGILAMVGTAMGVDPSRASSTEKGSLIVYPAVEIKWDDAGNVLQDTIIDLSNDYAGAVYVQLYFVNGDEPLEERFVGFPIMRMDEAEPGWNWADCRLRLTANQPIFFSALTAEPDGCQPFGVLDTPQLFGKWGRPDPETNGMTRVLRGFLLVWAVKVHPENGLFEEIRWNHLKGDAVVVNYANGTAWEYNAMAFQAHGVAHNEFLPTPGELVLDGFEYDVCPDELLLDFYGSGSFALSNGEVGTPGSVAVTNDTDLTLMPMFIDLRQDNDGPTTTKVEVEVWNEFESKFSGTRRCITCWDQTLLSNYVRSFAIPNYFLRETLRTDKGKARIDGLQSIECEIDEDDEEMHFKRLSHDAPLLGLSTKVLYFNGGADLAEACMNVVGMGEEIGKIEYDVVPPFDELMGGETPARETTRDARPTGRTSRGTRSEKIPAE